MDDRRPKLQCCCYQWKHPKLCLEDLLNKGLLCPLLVLAQVEVDALWQWPEANQTGEGWAPGSVSSPGPSTRLRSHWWTHCWQPLWELQQAVSTWQRCFHTYITQHRIRNYFRLLQEAANINAWKKIQKPLKTPTTWNKHLITAPCLSCQLHPPGKQAALAHKWTPTLFI